MRGLVRETALSAEHLVWPLFVQEGQKNETKIGSMPGQSRLSVDLLVERAKSARDLGVAGVALFPALEEKLKDPEGRESTNPDGLLQRAVRALKESVRDLLVITDVALDPYSSDGHDGVVVEGRIDNERTVPILAAMAVAQARAGADIVAPSDMMDGRVRAIRQALDRSGFTSTPIMSYAAKFASAFYGPFREAAESAPGFGDRRSYQMNPANAVEALREVALDIQEGADIVMVKPALAYLDVLHRVKMEFGYPTAAYAVSAEYSMIKAASAKGWIDESAVTLESLLAMRRAGADIVITYAAKEVAQWLKEGRA